MQVGERPWSTTEIKNPLKVLYNPICTFDFYETQFINSSWYFIETTEFIANSPFNNEIHLLHCIKRNDIFVLTEIKLHH